MNNLHIAISSDNNYLCHAIIASKSVAANNLSDFHEVHIHLLANNIPEESRLRFTSSLHDFGLKCHIHNIGDIADRLGINVPDTISISSYARLFLASIIDSDIDRIIYMDVDAINTASFKELWSMNLSEISVAGVLDDVALKAKEKIGIDCDAPYINAGFLLINLHYWRKYNLEKAFLDFLHKHDGKVFHHDQGIINAVCNKTLRILHPRYNMVSNFFSQPYESFHQKPFYSYAEIKEGIENPVFIHFTPGVVNRPWLRNCKHPLKFEYLKYRNETIYKNETLPYDNRPLKLRVLSFLFFHCRVLYRLIIKLRNITSDKI